MTLPSAQAVSYSFLSSTFCSNRMAAQKKFSQGNFVLVKVSTKKGHSAANVSFLSLDHGMEGSPIGRSSARCQGSLRRSIRAQNLLLVHFFVYPSSVAAGNKRIVAFNSHSSGQWSEYLRQCSAGDLVPVFLNPAVDESLFNRKALLKRNCFFSQKNYGV